MADRSEREPERRDAEQRPAAGTITDGAGTLESGAPEPAPPLPGADIERQADPGDLGRRTGGGSG